MFRDAYSCSFKTCARVVSGDRVVDADFGHRVAQLLGLVSASRLHTP